jgi:hypothetical protein
MFSRGSSSVGCGAGKEDEIFIRIRNYKGSGTPWLLRKSLVEGDSSSLITQKQQFDFVRSGNRDGCGEQLFAFANIAGEHRFADQPQVEPCIVAADLPVVWRIAKDEFDREAQLVCIKIARTLDARNEELRLDGMENGTWRRLSEFIGHGICKGCLGQRGIVNRPLKRNGAVAQRNPRIQAGLAVRDGNADALHRRHE